jgi:hypothetical protein
VFRQEGQQSNGCGLAPAKGSGEITLRDGQMWVGGYAPVPQHGATPYTGAFCAGIFVTSSRVVPSMLVVNMPPAPNPSGKWFPGQIYFAPGDFAVEPVTQPSSKFPFVETVALKH